MKLASLLNQDLICIGSPVTTREQAIELLVKKMHRHYSFELDAETVLETVRKREALGGTTFKSGITVAHARLEPFNDLIIGICIPEKPIPTEIEPVRMVVLILTEKSAPSIYLNTLAAFVGFSKNTDQFQMLLDSGSGNEFIETIATLDLRVKNELTVADIMTKELVTVGPENNIKELCDLFYSKSLSYIPVLDGLGEFIGEVDITDTIKLGIPDYATMIGSLNFIKTMEPFETLLKNEENLKVKQIMKKPSFKVTADASILEVALEMTQNKRRHIAVVNGKKIVGIVSTMDILNKVLRG